MLREAGGGRGGGGGGGQVSPITAIVVTHNSGTEVGRCLDSLQGKADVVVVDNASTDGTRDVVRQRPLGETPGESGKL